MYRIRRQTAVAAMVCLLGGSMTSGSARGDDPGMEGAAREAATEARPTPATAIGLSVGLGSAVGMAGISLTRALGDPFRVELGTGWGYSGWQVALMPKVAWGGKHDRFVGGAGLSLAFPTDSRYASGHPIWLNVDLGYEHRFGSGFALSAAIGLLGGLGGGGVCLPPDGCEPQFVEDVARVWAPQGRIMAAYWF